MRSSALILGNSCVLKKASNKTKIICSVTDRKPFVARGFCAVKISPELWLVQYETHSRRILGVHITGRKWHHITVKRNRTAEWRINVAFLDWECTISRYTSRRRVFSTVLKIPVKFRLALICKCKDETHVQHVQQTEFSVCWTQNDY